LAQLLERNGIQAKLFAQDVKVYLEISTADNTIKVQTALHLISIWASEWQLQLSISKCNILDIGHVSHDTTHTYTIDGSVLPCSVKCRDLGIIITRDLSQSQHIHAITAKAHQRANSIHRCFLSGDHNSLVRTFVVYVHPILEYNSVMWSPCSKCEIEEVEKVQRRFTKRLIGLNTSSYSDRLCRLGLPSLELRRLHLDLIFCYKLVFGVVSIKF